ncbi:MAG: glycosyltransferase family 25 protein [Bacteroidales bacterium]|jgi:glycosyl transferase family 25|nr:glycosyltransferase family 25 protein [Bacteroidales bacterium]
MLQELGIEGVYVIHAKTGYELQEERIQRLFGKHNIDFEFVTNGDVSVFDTLDIHKYVTESLLTRVRKGTVSCTLNHIFALQRIVDNKNKYALIFENDPFFIGDFHAKITRVMAEAQTLQPGFMISLENTTLKYPSYRTAKRGRYLYPTYGGRCAGAYLIDLLGAQKAVESLQTERCNHVVDWWHNRLVERGVVRMYWAHPVLIEQGSHNGLLCSSISSKEKSFARRMSWNLQKFYKSVFRRLFAQPLIIKD